MYSSLIGTIKFCSSVIPSHDQYYVGCQIYQLTKWIDKFKIRKYFLNKPVIGICVGYLIGLSTELENKNYLNALMVRLYNNGLCIITLFAFVQLYYGWLWWWSRWCKLINISRNKCSYKNILCLFRWNMKLVEIILIIGSSTLF